MGDSLSEGPQQAADPSPASVHAPEPHLPGTRAWFLIFLLWMGGWAALALLWFGRSELGDPVAMRLWLLALTCFYLSLCNTFLPLPTAWVVFLAASPEYALVQTGWLRVLFLGGLLGLATVVANLNEYHLLAFLLRFGLARRIRRTPVYGWAVRWFDRSPFQILALVAFVPIPVDALRWLAVLRGYSRLRFALAYFIGRGSRYVLFAGCSMLLQLKLWQILVVQAALVVGALLVRVLWRVVQRRWLVAQAGAAQTTLEAAARQ